MPTVPKTQTLNADGVQILNTIRANASLAYQDRVPKVTRENFADVGKIITEYDAFANEFLTNLDIHYSAPPAASFLFSAIFSRDNSIVNIM